MKTWVVILIIVGVLLLLTGIGVGIYFLTRPTPSPTPPPTPPSPPVDPQPNTNYRIRYSGCQTYLSSFENGSVSNNTSNNEIWKLVPVSNKPNTYYIVSVNPFNPLYTHLAPLPNINCGIYLDVPDKGLEWTLSKQTDGSYLIQTLYQGCSARNLDKVGTDCNTVLPLGLSNNNNSWIFQNV